MTASSPKMTVAQSQFILDILQQLQRVDPELPLHYAICLIHITMNEGTSLTQLSERTGLALSTISRIVGALSDYRLNGQSYELIDMRISAEERRRKELYLTPKGVATIRNIIAALERQGSVAVDKLPGLSGEKKKPVVASRARG